MQKYCLAMKQRTTMDTSIRKDENQEQTFSY